MFFSLFFLIDQRYLPDKSAMSTYCASSFSSSVERKVSGVTPEECWFCSASRSVRADMMNSGFSRWPVVVVEARRLLCVLGMILVASEYLIEG